MTPGSTVCKNILFQVADVIDRPAVSAGSADDASELLGNAPTPTLSEEIVL